jgi:hypothetical protein
MFEKNNSSCCFIFSIDELYNIIFFIFFFLVAAVYGNSHPEYAKYLVKINHFNIPFFFLFNGKIFFFQYVMAPISLVLLNPLGFLCMEVGERLKESRRNSQQMLPIQQSDSSAESTTDGQLSRKVSTASTASLSSVNHKRTRTNGCKVQMEFYNFQNH